MKNSQPILITQEETLNQTIDCLINHIEINNQGAFSKKDLFQLLVRAASNNDSIENTSKTLKNCPSGRNIRYHLDKFNKFETLESQVNLALKSQVLPRIIQGKLKLAIDLNLIPYYGEPSEEEKP